MKGSPESSMRAISILKKSAGTVLLNGIVEEDAGSFIIHSVRNMKRSDAIS